MKERVVLFSDAVIAIILTIMVVELPIKFVDGNLDVVNFFQAIGIYFISFCFVANVWFQLATAFENVKKLKSRELVIYFLLLFLLSLVPKFTELIIEDTTRSIVFFYGVLTFLVTFLMYRLLLVIKIQRIKENPDFDSSTVKKEPYMELILRLLVLMLAWLFPYIGLIFYLIFPVSSFLKNIIDREEAQFVRLLTPNQQKFYLKENNTIWKNKFDKYVDLLSTSISGDSVAHSGWQIKFLEDWEKNSDEKINSLNDEINTTEDQKIKEKLIHKKNELEKEKVHTSEKINDITSENDEKYEKLILKYHQDLDRLDDKIEKLQYNSESKEKNRKKMIELTSKKEKINLEFEDDKRKLKRRYIDKVRKKIDD